MTPPLFLVATLPAGDQLLLDGEEGRHAARVKRLAVGEALLVSDGAGQLVRCVVAAVLPDGLRLEVVSRRQIPAPTPSIVAVQALPKGERAELAVELLTELGVDAVVPWSAARAVVQWQGARVERGLQRWRRTAQEAAKQSRRAWVPEVGEPAGTAQVTERLRAAATALVLHEDAVQPLATVSLPADGEVVVVIGPEGGIAPEELAAFEAAGAIPVRLGSPVLRTSTAGGAALAALSLRLGRWGR